MTRKAFIGKMNVLLLAIHKYAVEHGLEHDLGQSRKRFIAGAKDVPARFGSYQQAWDFLKPTRDTFGID